MSGYFGQGPFGGYPLLDPSVPPANRTLTLEIDHDHGVVGGTAVGARAKLTIPASARAAAVSASVRTASTGALSAPRTAMIPLSARSASTSSSKRSASVAVHKLTVTGFDWLP